MSIFCLYQWFELGPFKTVQAEVLRNENTANRLCLPVDFLVIDGFFLHELEVKNKLNK